MIPLATLRELVEYNYWARDRQLQVCEGLTEEQFLRPLNSSYSSVRDTLAHLLTAEWAWSERWHGRSPTSQQAREFAPEKFPALDDIRARWSGVESRVRDLLAGWSEEALAGPFTYNDSKGKTWTFPLWQTVLHLANHQTYHRGQVTTLLVQLGAEPVPLDFLVALGRQFQR
jgi:uncharacterized damage-inducible protein DinB